MSSPSSVKIANFPEYVAILLMNARQRERRCQCDEWRRGLRVDERTRARSPDCGLFQFQIVCDFALPCYPHCLRLVFKSQLFWNWNYALERKHFSIEPKARVCKPRQDDDE